MKFPDRAELDAARDIVRAVVPPTPAYAWPLLRERLGTEVIVKHENHTPTGAFKVRGGLVYFDRLARREPGCPGVVSATRGNHGQSVALAAARNGIPATIVVPRGNSREKNAAMRAFGATLIEYGDDFQESREHAAHLAAAGGLHMVPSFHRDLILGVATYWMELLGAHPDIDVVFVPIGLGSGICSAIVARQVLGLKCAIIGVVSELAPAYALSFAAGRAIDAPVSTMLADGMACRTPDPESLAMILAHMDDVVQVSDEQVAGAMKIYFIATHNVAEGAGAAPLAAALAHPELVRGRRVGLPLCGGNVDHDVFAEVLLRPLSD
ncbi:MAG: threonine dehydratase [Burkholderiaceae bacterium]|nr:threonine dehydratase [Burkholderiaceae bacterium]